MSTEMATDEVTDMIAHIEMHRQEMVKETGLAPACGEALRKLHELLEHERSAMQLHGTSTTHPANIEAITIEIKRVRQLAAAINPKLNSPQARPRQQPGSRSNMPHNSPRNKGRRTMGRRGGER
jgi:hypothetical protein